MGEDHSYKRLTPALRYGQHTQEILKDLDYSENEIAALIHLGVSYEYLPTMGSKEAYFFQPETK